MSDPKDQDQDLEWQKNGESDSLQKSENPDSDYMVQKSLCVKCHGPKKPCDLEGCPQK